MAVALHPRHGRGNTAGEFQALKMQIPGLTKRPPVSVRTTFVCALCQGLTWLPYWYNL